MRVRIIDVDPHPMFRTPEASKPYIGKEGTAVLSPKEVEITLDDGTILYGSECWWEEISEQGREGSA